MTALRIHGAGAHEPEVTLLVDGRALPAVAGESLAAALAAAGLLRLRAAPRTGAPRGAFCFMGICQECLVQVDGAVRQACLVPVAAGMSVALRGATE